MSTHSLDNQLAERLLTKINNLEQQVREFRTLQQQGSAALNMLPTGVYVHTMPDLPSGSAVVFKATLSNSNKKMIHSDFFFTLYQGSVAPENRIGHVNALGYGYRWYYWRDWSSLDLAANGYNSSEYIWVENQTGAAQTIVCNMEWRYIVNGGTVVVS